MTVIAAYLYRNGRRVEPVSLDHPVHCASDSSEFVWIDLYAIAAKRMRRQVANAKRH